MGGDDATIVQQFIDQTGATFPVGWDSLGSYFDFPRDGSISPFPLDVIVDRDGTIVYFSREYDGEAMRAVVQTLVDSP